VAVLAVARVQVQVEVADRLLGAGVVHAVLLEAERIRVFWMIQILLILFLDLYCPIGHTLYEKLVLG
jgi:hypothetical protein